MKRVLITTSLAAIIPASAILIFASTNPSYTDIGKDRQSHISSTIFPTGLTPSKYHWVDNDEILAVYDEKVVTYRIKTREKDSIFTIGLGKLKDAQFGEPNIFLIEYENNLAIVFENQDVTPLILPLNTAVLFSDSMIVTSSYERIYQRESAATHISQWSYNKDGATLQREYSTNYTLVPVSAQDYLILMPPYPIRPKIYMLTHSTAGSWDLQSYQIPDKDEHELRFLGKYIGERTRISIRIHEILRSSLEIAIPKSVTAWNLTSSGGVVYLHEKILTICKTGHDCETMTIPHNTPKFTHLVPSPNTNSVILQTEEGELWILER